MGMGKQGIGKNEGGDGASILGEIKKFADKIIDVGFAAIWVSTQSAIAKASCLLYAKIKALYDALPKIISSAVVLTNKLGLDNRAIQLAADGKLYFVAADGSAIRRAAKLDLSDAANYLSLPSGYWDGVPFGIFEKIDIVIVNISGTVTLKIYNKSGNLLTELANDYGLVSASAFFRSPIKKDADTGNILIGTTTGILELEDATEEIEETEEYTATPIFHALGKAIHSFCKFKGAYYIGFTNAIGASDIGHQYAPVDLVEDTIGEVICVRDTLASAWHPHICSNNDYIVIREKRADVSGWKSFHSYSTNGTTWIDIEKTTDNDIWLNNTDDNRFVIFGKKIGLTKTSNPFGEWNVIATSENISTDNDKGINAILTSEGIAANSLSDNSYVYAMYDKEIKTKEFTIGEDTITISYYELPDGSAVCLPSQQTNLDLIFAAVGKVNFFVLDVENETIRPIRDNTNGYQYINVGGSYKETTTEKLAI